MAVFNFCPDRMVPETLPREPTQVISMNSWQFSAKPTTPYQRRFKLTLYGLRWYLNSTTDLYDYTTNAQFNARALERFYEEHETWKPFDFTHPHFGPIVCRFASAVTVPAAPANSGGLLGPVEVNLIHHNPGYSS